MIMSERNLLNLKEEKKTCEKKTPTIYMMRKVWPYLLDKIDLLCNE